MKIRVSHRETIQESNKVSAMNSKFGLHGLQICFKKRKIDSLWHIVENDPPFKKLRIGEGIFNILEVSADI